MTDDLSNTFPLSREKVLKGNRRLAREKVLQTLFAYKMSDTDVDVLFNHIYDREFNFGDADEELQKDKILNPNQVHELEADVRIAWGDSEIKFLHKLLETTLKTSDETDARMREKANNWDLDRFTLIDRLLVQIAVAELLNFDDIPPKVTINEAIDIAKKYSTDKSGHFINGILDAMYNSLKDEGLIVKKGRGLVEK